ncbi:MAG: ABC transporter permease [Thermoanaerobaculia bacterium]
MKAETRARAPLVELTRMRLLAFAREPGVIFWVFVFPVLLAVALGTAFRTKPPEDGRVAVVEGDAAAATAHARLDGSAGLVASLLPVAAAAEALRTGKVDLVVAVERGEAGGPRYRYRFDPTRPQSRAVRLAVDDALQRALGRRDPAPVAEALVTERGARYVDFLLPGLIGLNLMGSSMWGIGFSLVMSRSRRMLKRLAASPMRRAHYLLAAMLSRLAFLLLELAALVGFGALVLGVEVRGSLLDLTLVALLGGAAFAGIALLVAARPTSIEVASGWMNFVMLPMWVLSGSFFSYARFPEWLQPAIRALPLTALNDALRSVMNEGASLLATAPELGVLAVWGLACFALALKLFRWQ